MDEFDFKPFNNDWEQWVQRVTKELIRLNSLCEQLDRKLDRLQTRLIETEIKVNFRSGIWMALVIMTPVILIILLLLVSGIFGKVR